MNIITHPPPRLRVFAAPFQIVHRSLRPTLKVMARLKRHLEVKGSAAAARYEAKRMLFEQNLITQTERIIREGGRVTMMDVAALL